MLYINFSCDDCHKPIYLFSGPSMKQVENRQEALAFISGELVKAVISTPNDVKTDLCDECYKRRKGAKP